MRQHRQHIPASHKKRPHIPAVILRPLILIPARPPPHVPSVEIEPIPRKAKQMQHRRASSALQHKLLAKNTMLVGIPVRGQRTLRLTPAALEIRRNLRSLSLGDQRNRPRLCRPDHLRFTQRTPPPRSHPVRKRPPAHHRQCHHRRATHQKLSSPQAIPPHSNENQSIPPNRPRCRSGLPVAPPVLHVKVTGKS